MVIVSYETSSKLTEIADTSDTDSQFVLLNPNPLPAKRTFLTLNTEIMSNLVVFTYRSLLDEDCQSTKKIRHADSKICSLSCLVSIKTLIG